MNTNGNTSTLIVAAHPDDEVLGCGGTICRLAAQGCEVHILILAEGLTSRQPEREPEKLEAPLSDLHGIARQVGDLLGARSVRLGGLADNRMDGVDLLDIVKVIEERTRTLNPGVVFTHNPSDLNIDHRITAEATLTAVRPQPGQTVRAVHFFEVPSSTEWRAGPGFAAFQPNYFVSLSEEHLSRKIRALSLYGGEMRAFPHARSVEAVEHLARWRGASVGERAAEAFMTFRAIE